MRAPPASQPPPGRTRFRGADFGAFRVEAARFAPGLFLPRHIHERAVFAVFLHGAMETSICGRTLDCRPSSVLVEPRGEPHSQRFRHTGAELLVIQPDPARMDSFEGVRKLFDEVERFEDRRIATIARRIVHEFRAPDGVSRLAIEGLALEIVALAARLHDRGRIGVPPPAWLLQAREIVHDRFLEKLRVSDVASEVGVHPVHLSRIFRRHYGSPIGSYLRALRLDWAAERLLGDESLATIALEAGFADQSHFTNTFRRHMGVTPGQYRDARR